MTAKKRRQTGRDSTSPRPRVLVVGAGPAGLAAATAAAQRSAAVTIAEAGRIAGRKFLVAGKGGLNLTHSEPLEVFLTRYGAAAEHLAPFLRAYPPDALRALAASLGQETFVGTSGRVFPKDAKAAPMLRAWIARLKKEGVAFHTGLRFAGFASAEDGAGMGAVFANGEVIETDAIVLALGGASWPETGSTGTWVPLLRDAGVEVADLEPSNAGVDVQWPKEFVAAHEGAALKSVALSLGSERAPGDAIVTRSGLEGTPVYRLNAGVRALLARGERPTLLLDLKPDLSVDALAKKLGGSSKSLSTKLKALRLPPAALALLRTRPREAGGPEAIAARLKAFPIEVRALRGLAEAISSAGGVRWSALDANLMLRRRPGVFVAGEMIDWDAPTGGYLLQASVSTGMAAGSAAASHAVRALSQ